MTHHDGRIVVVACAVLFAVALLVVAWGNALAGAQPTADTTGVTIGQGIRVSLADTGPAWLGETVVVAGIFVAVGVLGVGMGHVLGRVSGRYPPPPWADRPYDQDADDIYYESEPGGPDAP